MPLEDILAHVATPIREEELGPKIDGERDTDDVRGEPFDCVLFLPLGKEDDRRGRQVKRPQLMFLPFTQSGAPFALKPEDRLGIVAPELNAALGEPAEREVEWQVDGDPQPLGKPGEDVVGLLANLRRVEG